MKYSSDYLSVIKSLLQVLTLLERRSLLRLLYTLNNVAESKRILEFIHAYVPIPIKDFYLWQLNIKGE